MFDYAAGEKYKLTLIMVALAGIMAGMFVVVVLMPTPEAPHARPKPAWMNDPDANGGKTGVYGAAENNASTSDANEETGSTVSTRNVADPNTALNLVEQWLPLAWDLSAGTAQSSQEKAIRYMTGECADAYRHNIWTPQLAKQIEQAQIKSSFKASKVAAGVVQADGSVVIFVEGEQVLSVPSKGDRARQVKLEYLVKNTPEGLRIAGISEGGQSG